MERQNHHRGHRHDGAVLSIDYYAYASAIRGWNPYYRLLRRLPDPVRRL